MVRLHTGVVPGHFRKPVLQVHPQFDPPQVAAPKFAPVSTWLSDGAGQALPQEPQFCTSDDKVLHDPEHPVCPVET